MRKALVYIGMSVLCCLACIQVMSQTVSVSAQIDRSKILIGEPITLKLEATMPLSTAANWFPLDSLAHFEFIEKRKIDTSSDGELKTYSQVITLTSFDSGRWAIPSLPLEVGNRSYLTDSLPVSVAYINFDPKQDYHDIKDIIEVAAADTGYINWIIAAVGLLALLAFVYFMWRKKKVLVEKVVEQPKSGLTPFDEAMQSLKQLRVQAEGADAKVYHTRLNDVLRVYVLRKTGQRTMEKTSDELLMQLKTDQLERDDLTRLAQALRMSDAVKFARFQPSGAENREALDVIKVSIEKLDKHRS